MTTLARRPTNPLTEMLGWLDTDTPFGFRSIAGTPLVRIEDFLDADTYVVRADLPGIDPEHDIEVSVAGDVLTITGERREEEQDRHYREVHYGSFVRSVQLPVGARIDVLTATYTDGVLEVRVPLEPEKHESRTVPVQRPETSDQ